MKRIALILGAFLSTASAIGVTGCAHQQLTNQQVAQKTVLVGTVALIILAGMAAENAAGTTR